MHPFPPGWRGWRSALPSVLAGALLSLAALEPVFAQAACNAAAATPPKPMLMHVETVPDLRGCSLDEARKLLVVRKLRLTTASAEKVAATALIETQSPRAGDAYPSNRLVTVTVSTGGIVTPPPGTASATEDIPRKIPGPKPDPDPPWPPAKATAPIGVALVALLVAIGVAVGLLHRQRVRRRWSQALRFGARLEGPASARCGPLTAAAPPVRITVDLEHGESRIGAPLSVTVTRN